MERYRVAVVGGGIGGLTAALALQQRGIDAHVFEAAPEIRVVGAGIWLPSNALQVLHRLGMAESLVAAGRPLVRAEVHDARRGLLRTIDLQAAAGRYGFGSVAIHRARLQQVLADALEPARLHTGKSVVALDPPGGSIRVRFDDGTAVEARVVVGADGLRSVVRRQLFPGVELRHAGQTSYRAVVRADLREALDGVSRELWGPGCRFGFSAIGEGEVYWYATLDAPPGGEDPPEGPLPSLAARFTGFPDPVGSLLEAAASEPIVRTDLADIPPMSRWHGERTVLLGDAAHAATPNLGQGGAQAIESAWVLAEQLALHPVPEDAFRAYERLRMPKAHRVTERSRQLGRLPHLRRPLARGVRNLALRWMPAALARREMHDLYRLDY
jgi:2-polyprenyl-6-methoxyphenol hydroxylase-like FAD-dependent oxidoreductase